MKVNITVLTTLDRVKVELIADDFQDEQIINNIAKRKHLYSGDFQFIETSASFTLAKRKLELLI